MVFHPLITNQIHRILFQPLSNDSFKRLIICVFEKDVVACVASIQRMIDYASLVRSECTRHETLPSRNWKTLQPTPELSNMPTQIANLAPDTFIALTPLLL